MLPVPDSPLSGSTRHDVYAASGDVDLRDGAFVGLVALICLVLLHLEGAAIPKCGYSQRLTVCVLAVEVSRETSTSLVAVGRADI